MDTIKAETLALDVSDSKVFGYKTSQKIEKIDLNISLEKVSSTPTALS